MKWIRPRPCLWVFCLMLILESSVFSGMARSANRVLDIKMSRADGRVRLALLLQQKPGYGITCPIGNQVDLVLYDVSGTAELSKAAAREEKSVRLEQDEAAHAMKIAIPLKASLREIECSWIPKESVFLMEMVEGGKSHASVQKSAKRVSLKTLRFGVQETLTRMVADLGVKTAWSLTSRDDRLLVFHLSGASTGLQRGSYGPMKRLRSVLLNKKGEDLELKADAESPLGRVKVFWFREEGRWVADFFDHGPEKLDTAFRFDKRPDPPPEKLPAPIPPILPIQKDIPKENGPAGVAAADGKKEAQAPQREEKAEGPSMGGTAVVRMKIEKPADPEPRVKSMKMTAPKVEPLKIEPKIRYALPDMLPDVPRVTNLRPAEAILYGRIREVLEAKDYEKGAGLVDEFIGNFPDSPLIEDLLFLAGDCRFALMEKGNKPLYTKVISTYQDAISRFMKSPRVPGALIRMGRAHEIAGNSHEAIGTLTIAIKQHGTGDHLPVALVARGRIYLQLNQPQRAVEDFKFVIQGFPGSPLVEEAHYGIAGYFHGVGMYDEAESKLKEIANSKPDFSLEHPEFLFLRARNYFYRKNYDLARDQYYRALNLGHQPESSDLLISHIGDTYFHQSMQKEAEVFYRIADLYYPDTEGAGIAKLRIADQTSGVSAYEEVYRKNVNKPVGDLAVLEMAGKFYKKGQYALAVETLKKLTGKTVQTDVQREARQLIFRCAEKEIKNYHEAGQYEKVTDYFQTADPPLTGSIEPETMMLVGEAFYHRQQYTDAVRVFSQLSLRELNPASKGRYLIMFAKIHLSQGDEESARSLLENAAGEKVPPADQQRTGLLLAEVYQRKGELKRAVDLFNSILGEKRLLSDQEMARLYLNLGQIHNRRNLYEKARESLNRSIALAEKEKDSRELLRTAYVEMGNSYHHEGRHREAVRYYGQCLDFDYGPETKGYWEVKYKLAVSYLGTGESAMAERIMNEIAEEGDPALQQRVQMKMGLMSLEKELKRLPLGGKGVGEQGVL